MSDNSQMPADTNQPYANKRTVPRYTFAATAEIIEPLTDTRFSGRISEISRKGCYLDILNTLPKGSPVQLTILRDRGTFVTPGEVIYVQEQVGMGVAFKNAPSDQMEILDTWLDELKG